MNILIVGAGGVGFTLAERLTADGHQVTLVDTDQRRIDHCLDRLDVQALLGNGVSHKMLEEAGARRPCPCGHVRGRAEYALLSRR